MSTFRPGDYLDAEFIRNGEQSRYNFTRHGHSLLIVKKELSVEEIARIVNGSVELALYVDGPVLILLYRFNNETEFFDAPFSWHGGSLDSRAELNEDVVSPFEYIFRIILAEASKGVVAAVREITLTESFAQKFHNIILHQSKSLFNAYSFGKHLNTVYNGNTSSEMAEMAEAYIKIT